MATQKLTFRPGVNLELSQTLNEGGLSGSNLIRTREGLPEKLGGWMRLSSIQMSGSVRAMHAWADLTGVDYLALGSDTKLQVFSATVVADITPIRKTSNLTNPLSTTTGSPLVTVADTANGVVVGDYVNFPIPAAIGGLIVYGSYPVVAVLTANTYQINAGSNATGTVSGGGTVPTFTTTNTSATVTVTLAGNGFPINTIFNIFASTAVGGLTLVGDFLINTVPTSNTFTITAGSTASSGATVAENSGNVRILYLLAAGQASNTALSGWGSGTWGTGTWGGTGSGAGVAPLRNWSLDNFGQNLVAVPTNGALYQWVPPISSGNRATLVTQAPSPNYAMFVAQPQEQVVLLGSSVSGVQDPMLIAWCDAGDITDWTADITNQAGTFRLSRGSKIVGGVQAALVALIWTDVGLWTMSYIQPPFVYSFNEIARGCGLLAQHAFCILNQQVYWLNNKSFFVLDGQGVRPLDCTVWDFIFKNLTTTQVEKTFMGANSNFSEAACFFPSATGNGEIDSYVKFNQIDTTWDFGNLVRLSWVDQSVFGSPVGIDGPNGLMQQHETSVDADGQPMQGVEILTGYADLEGGETFIFIHQLIPDFVWKGSTDINSRTLTVTIYLLDYPGDTDGAGPGILGPFTISSSTQYITIQRRCRQIAMKIQSDGLGVQWRLGAFRWKGAPDGRL